MTNDQKIKKIISTIEYYRESLESLNNDEDIDTYWSVIRSDEIEDKKIKRDDFSSKEKKDFLTDFYNYLALDTIKQLVNQK